MIKLSKPKLYLETTVFNYHFLDDPLREQDKSDTIELFSQIREGLFEAYFSDVVEAEIIACSEPKRSKMLGLIRDYQVQPVENYQGFGELVNLYLAEGIIPRRKMEDMVHIALATVNDMDVLVSWNCSHIVKFKTIKVVNLINEANGYKRLFINTPKEVVESE